MSASGKRPSRKFRSNLWIDRLVPVILILLAILLIGTLVLVVLSLLGVLPSS